jgi:hypothetical protein
MLIVANKPIKLSVVMVSVVMVNVVAPFSAGEERKSDLSSS